MPNDMEIFAKFSASGYENPKLMTLALNHPSAYRVWTWAIMYSVRNLSDGFIPEIIAKTTLAARKKDLETLESSGFFEPVDDGWMIHDFLESQGRSRADVEGAKAQKVEKARKAAEARWGKTGEGDATSNARAIQARCLDDATGNAQAMQARCSSDAKRCPDTDTDTDTEKKENTSYFPEKKSKIKPTFQIDASSRAHAVSLRLDPDGERDRFVDHWLADGGRRADWQAMFRGWCDRSPNAKPPVKPELPSDGWFTSEVVRHLPDGADLNAAKRSLYELIRDGMAWEVAAQRVIHRYSSPSGADSC